MSNMTPEMDSSCQNYME